MELWRYGVLWEQNCLSSWKYVLSLIAYPLSPYNLMPTSNFKDCKINMHLCSKSPVQPQGKYLNNIPFICALRNAVKSRYKGKREKEKREGRKKGSGERAIAMAMEMAKG